jgi:HD-GYP domain-containing protein (c-di-GMP phosphodiesterase class II)
LSARIIAIADVYDALTTDRPYRRAQSHEKAVQIIRSEGGSHFDPDLVEAFLDVNDGFRRIRLFGDFQDRPETIDDLLKGSLKIDISDLDLGQ